MTFDAPLALAGTSLQVASQAVLMSTLPCFLFSLLLPDLGVPKEVGSWLTLLALGVVVCSYLLIPAPPVAWTTGAALLAVLHRVRFRPLDHLVVALLASSSVLLGAFGCVSLPLGFVVFAVDASYP